jgi:hypothetical protein
MEEIKMNFTKSLFVLALGSAGIIGAMSAHAMDLNAGDKLTISSGVEVFDSSGYLLNVSSGSFFSVDGNGDSNIQGGEKTALSQGSTGIIIGASNTALGEITAPWLYISNPGYDWVSTAVTGGTGGLDMSGWTANWTGLDIGLGAGAWQVLNASSGMPTSGYTNGTAIFNWSGIYGDAYTLDYTATVQSGPFSGQKYALHLEGVTAVPEASSYAMMLAGLGLVGGMAARRRKQAEL